MSNDTVMCVDCKCCIATRAVGDDPLCLDCYKGDPCPFKRGTRVIPAAAPVQAPTSAPAPLPEGDKEVPSSEIKIKGKKLVDKALKATAEPVSAAYKLPAAPAPLKASLTPVESKTYPASEIAPIFRVEAEAGAIEGDDFEAEIVPLALVPTLRKVLGRYDLYCKRLEALPADACIRVKFNRRQKLQSFRSELGRRVRARNRKLQARTGETPLIIFIWLDPVEAVQA